MIKIRVFGNKVSRNIHKIKDLNKIGFLYLLLEHCNDDLINTDDFSVLHNIDIVTIKQYLIDAKELDIITLDTTVTGENIILEVGFVEQVIAVQETHVLIDAFGISKLQIDELEKNSMVDGVISNEVFINNFIILTRRIDLPHMINKVSINSQADLILFLETAYLQDIFKSWNLKPSNNELMFLMGLLIEKQMDKALINLLIDYSIKTNTYHNFNVNFATKVANTWIKKEVDTVEKGLVFLSEVKELLTKKHQKDKYVAPEFMEVEVDKTALPSDLEIEDIIENVYN